MSKGRKGSVGVRGGYGTGTGFSFFESLLIPNNTAVISLATGKYTGSKYLLLRFDCRMCGVVMSNNR